MTQEAGSERRSKALESKSSPSIMRIEERATRLKDNRALTTTKRSTRVQYYSSSIEIYTVRSEERFCATIARHDWN